MYNYEVWVGGIIDFETPNINKAIVIAKEFIKDGYNDCQIQIVDNNNEAIARVCFDV